MKFKVVFETLPQSVDCPKFKKFTYEACGINHGEAIAENIFETVRKLAAECDYGITVSAYLHWELADGTTKSRKVWVK